MEVTKLKINKKCLDIVLAQQCKSLRDMRGTVCASTLSKISRSEDLKPKTVGKIARALNVDAKCIVEEAK